MSDAYIVRRGGGGAGGLNFKIVGGTTRPGNPKENTIWVNTPHEITSWVISANEPTGETGKVWLVAYDMGSAAFNPFVNGEMLVAVSDVYLFTSDTEHERVDAYIYQGGEWIEIQSLGLYLFKSGSGALVEFSASGTATFTDVSIEFDCDGNTKRLLTADKIDVSNYNTLYVDATNTGSTSGFFRPFLMVASELTDVPDKKVVVRTDLLVGSERQITQLDISELSGAFYLGIVGTYKGFVYNLWME